MMHGEKVQSQQLPMDCAVKSTFLVISSYKADEIGCLTYQVVCQLVLLAIIERTGATFTYQSLFSAPRVEFRDTDEGICWGDKMYPPLGITASIIGE